MPFKRSSKNPIITREDVPDIPPELVDATSVFNPGATEHDGKTLLMLRVQSRGRRTFLVMAESDDGLSFRIRDRAVRFEGIERIPETVYHVYDPRITPLEGAFCIAFAVDTDLGCRLGVARTADFERFEFLGLSDEDLRNGVLFPERFDGSYLRLERPNWNCGDEIRLSESRDLVHWNPLRTVIRGRPHYWDERIGPGPPPVKTREGWLQVYHGVATHFDSVNIYQAGVLLLDLNDPGRVLARTRDNVLEPRESYELVGQVPNVVFPSGMIVESFDNDGFACPDARIRLYYGAADTSVGLATATVAELIAACHEGD